MLGSRLVPLMRIIIVLFYPLAKPLSLVLDVVLGEEIGTFYSKKEVCALRALLQLFEDDGMESSYPIRAAVYEASEHAPAIQALEQE